MRLPLLWVHSPIPRSQRHRNLSTTTGVTSGCHLQTETVPPKSVSMCFAVSLRDDEVGHCPPDGLVSRPPEDAHRAIMRCRLLALFGHGESPSGLPLWAE
jgi:hypothetical protein